MRTYSIEAGKDSPYVYLDESTGLVKISGNSTLKEAYWFYTNLLKWLIVFNSGQSRTATVDISLQRINDSTSKWLPLIFNKLNKIIPDSSLEINWYVNSKSPRIKESGQLLKNKIEFRVNMLAYHRDF